MLKYNCFVYTDNFDDIDKNDTYFYSVEINCFWLMAVFIWEKVFKNGPNKILEDMEQSIQELTK